MTRRIAPTRSSPDGSACSLPTRRTSSPHAGFTLIEALVAFTIMALVTIVIQRAVTVSVGGVARADTRVEAELVARTLMTGPLGIGQGALKATRGELNGYQWTMRLEPLDLPFPTTDGNPPAWIPLRMIVEISSKNRIRPDLVVETVRLVKIAS